ncbi:MAG TPA: signal peptidase II [Acidimicrobiales bacterium]|nr:signal peptidase II [Acidimicrobiales bacterium]
MPGGRLTRRVNPTVIVVALVVTALDALTKAWARHDLAHHNVHVAGAVWLKLRFNAGVSFSVNPAGPFLTTVVTIVVALVVVVVGLRARPGVAAVGFGLLLGGGLANVIDRLAAQPHRVTDFIALGNFPVFNLADVSITAGFIVLLVVALRGEALTAR